MRVPQALNGTAELHTEVDQVATAHVAQLTVLELLPQPIGWIELRRVARQLLQVNPPAAALRQEGLDRLGSMNG